MTIQISTDLALNELHRQFLEIWPTKRVREMKLDDYVVGGHDARSAVGLSRKRKT